MESMSIIRMDQRPGFDHSQNDQEITNDEKLGLV